MATATPAAGRLLTIAEYEALGEDTPGERWELDEGELIVSAASRYDHNKIRDVLASNLRRFAKRAGCGDATAETDTRAGERTIRRPDVGFYSPQRLASMDLSAWPQPVPDIAFEVVSRNDRADQLMKKIRQYLKSGTSVVWLLYPQLGLAHRYTAADSAPQVFAAAAGHALTEPDWLPGFSAPLAAIFAAEED